MVEKREKTAGRDQNQRPRGGKRGMQDSLEGSRQPRQTGADFNLKRIRRECLGYSAGNVQLLNVYE